MKTKFLAMLLVVCMVMSMLPATALAADTVVTLADLKQAITDAGETETTITISGTIAIDEKIIVPANVTLTGGTLKVSVNQGITLSGTLSNLAIENTCDAGTVNAVYMNSGAAVTGCNFTGKYNMGDGETSRGIEVAPGANVTITGNSFKNLRQPGYINNECTGTISNNTVDVTRGWVICCDSNMTITGNKFGTNAVDICIISSNTPTNNYSSKTVALSKNNNGAFVEDQVASLKAQDGALIADSAAALAAAIAAVADGDTVTLLKSIELATKQVIDKEVTIDLAGNSITMPNDTAGDGVFQVVTNGKLTINDSDTENPGTICGVSAKNDYDMALWANGGEIIINGGRYIGTGAGGGTEDTGHYDLIYAGSMAGSGGKITINGGYFEAAAGMEKYTLNINNTASIGKNGEIVVKGGTFKDYDPADGDDAIHGPFVAEGYVSTKSGDNYVVTEGVKVASVGGKEFSSLSAAVEAADAGATVTLINDALLHGTIYVEKKVTVDLAGYDISMYEYDDVGDGVFCVTAGGDLTLNDSVGTGVVNGASAGNEWDMTLWAKGGKITINGGTYNNLGADGLEPGSGDARSDMIYSTNGEIIIKGGYFESQSGEERYVLNQNNSNPGTITVYGGYFKDYDPAEGDDNLGGNFVAEGYVSVPSSESGYYEVQQKNEEVTVETDVSAGNTTVVAPDGASEEVTNVVDAITGSGMMEEAAANSAADLVAAAGSLANDNNVVGDTAILEAVKKNEDIEVEVGNDADAAAVLKEVLKDKDVTVGDEDPVTVHVQPYLNIQVTDVETTGTADPSGSPPPIQSITVEIEPMYNVVATTAEGNEPIVTESSDEQDAPDVNAVVIAKEQPMTIKKGTPVTISIPLPTRFTVVDSKIYVEHVKSDGTTYVYTATVTDDIATFVNPNGFSEFTLRSDNTAVAKIGDVGYLTLQDAVDAVQDGETIELLADCSGEHVEVNVSKNVGELRFRLNKGEFGFSLTPGDNTEMIPGDINGNIFEYTFVYVPTSTGSGNAGKPSVNETPAEPKPGCDGGEGCPCGDFTDLDADEWYHEAVDYVLNEGLMNGIGGGKFGPNDTTTRGMVVTMLWRLAGEPDAKGANPFTDVADDQWYTEAVIWAYENEVVNGMGNDLFMPNAEITREQLFTMLYNYAKFAGYDVSADDELNYADADDISSWAVDAMKWAVAEGLVNGIDGKLLPGDNATRAQLAKLIMGFLETL